MATAHGNNSWKLLKQPIQFLQIRILSFESGKLGVCALQELFIFICLPENPFGRFIAASVVLVKVTDFRLVGLILRPRNDQAADNVSCLMKTPLDSGFLVVPRKALVQLGTGVRCFIDDLLRRRFLADGKNLLSHFLSVGVVQASPD